MTFGSFGRSFVLVLVLVLVLVHAPSATAQPTNAPSILVSRQLAEERHLAVGDLVQLGPDANGAGARTFTVAGIYEPTPDPMRLGSVPRQVRLHLPDLLALTRDAATPPGSEYVEAVNIKLANGADAERFSQDLNGRLPGVLARPAAAASGSAGPFVVIERFHLAIATVTIIAATVFLLALTIMLVDERRETVGVLRLIGLPARRILVQIFLEGALIAMAGGIFGLGLARASERAINSFFQWRYNTALIFVKVTPDVAALCLAIAVPLGAVATVVASWALLRRGALRLARR